MTWILASIHEANPVEKTGLVIWNPVHWENPYVLTILGITALMAIGAIVVGFTKSSQPIRMAYSLATSLPLAIAMLGFAAQAPEVFHVLGATGPGNANIWPALSKNMTIFVPGALSSAFLLAVATVLWMTAPEKSARD